MTGGSGAAFGWLGGELAEITPPWVDAIGDVTGAGDAMAAGVIHGLLSGEALPATGVRVRLTSQVSWSPFAGRWPAPRWLLFTDDFRTMAAFNTERVLSVHHWNNTLFSFTTTRDPSLRFRNGQFVMIGLEVNGKPLLRAYSIASPNYAEHLEFFSIKVVHGVRVVSELAYHEFLNTELPNNEFLGDDVRNKLIYYPTVTREPYRNMGRLTDLVDSGKLFADIGLPPLDPLTDRAMVCGSPQMLADCCTMLDQRGFEISARSGEPGDYVIERAFVER